MQQSMENMTKLYGKANQDAKQKILLTFLGKVIAENKILVLDAFTKEGIKVNPKISTEDLIRKIKNTILNADDRTSNNLKTSLSILILSKKDSLNFSDYSNVTGTDFTPTTIFNQLVEVDRKGVLELFSRLKILAYQNKSNKYLAERINSVYFGTIHRLLHPEKNKLFKEGIKKLLIKNGIKTPTNFSDFSNLFGKNKGAKVPKAPKSAKVKSPKTKDGNMITRLFKRGEDGNSKAGNFYRANKGSIDVIGGALIDGLTKDRSGKIIENGAIENEILNKENESGNEGKNTKGMTPIVKYAIIGAVVLVVGYVGYKFYMKGMKGKTNQK